MTFEEFLLEAQPLGREFKKTKGADQQQYLNALAELASQLDAIPPVAMDNSEAGWAWTLLGYKAPVGSVLMQLEQGGSLPLHDHRGYISLLLVVSGSVKVTHYGSDDISPRRKTFSLSKKSEQVLSAGEIAFASAADNIHSLEDCGDGCVLLDVSTFLKAPGISHEILLEPGQSDDEFVGRWSGSTL